MSRLLFLVVMTVLLTSACGGAPASPTVGPEAIFTSAAQTFEAQLATQAALVPPSQTPSPSPFPTFAVPSPLATISFASATPLVGGKSDCDGAAWLADVTIPDGTVMQPGQSFTKTWSMYNSGTCPWSTSYKLVFQGGDSMGATSAFLPISVPIGGTVDVSVNLRAPDDGGSFKSNWQLQNDKNQAFGSIVYVQIQVGASGSVQAGPTSSTGSVTISGTFTSQAGAVDGITVNYSGTKGGTGSVKTDGSGAYSFIVPSGWSGTITPSKGIWHFDPANLSFPNLYSDQTANFKMVP
ncbi:MAG TPA: NBR1-Ig-like domain-containing protein [Anaerolineales bacterium]